MKTGDEKPRVVIVGAGFGGLEAARCLKKAPLRVTLIDRNNYHLFQPLLYQVATAGLSPGDIAEPARRILRKNSNTEVLMGEVVGIDLKNRSVELKDRSILFDFLILAPGARYHYFGHEEWSKIAPGLKSVEDALEIRRKILTAFEKAEMEDDPERRRAHLTFVIIGGGPTGVELAGSIAELAHKALAADFRRMDPASAHILLLEAGPKILSGFSEDLPGKAEKALQHLGVEVRVNTPVEKVEPQGVWIQGDFLPAQTILWAAGIVASPLMQCLGAPTDRLGRVKVDSDLSLPNHPEVFVIGDAATVVQEGKVLPGLAPVATQEGRYVAWLIKKRVGAIPSQLPAGRRESPPQALPPFRYFDKGQLATVGRSFAVAEFGRFKISGFFAWLVWLFVHIFFLIGMENRVLVFIQWAWSYFTFERGARIITYEKRSLSETRRE